MRLLRWAFIILLLLAGAGYAAFNLSPWPSVLLIRHVFDSDSANRNKELAALAPPGIVEIRDKRYGVAPAQRLDVYRPAQPTAGLPLVVWIHGGGFIAGQKEDLSGYLRVLAGRGHRIVAIGYSIAPGARYPTPVIEANAALRYLSERAGELELDAARIVLVGDSAGAQIAAQLAVALTDPNHAKALGLTPALDASRLVGIALFCGLYEAGQLNTEGAFGGFIRTILWSYFGSKDLTGDPRLAEFSVMRHVGPRFPPAFLSVGSADPLEPQTEKMAEALKAQGVAVETLFFPANQQPRLEHEYQFRLDIEAGRLAFDRLDAFIRRR